MGTTDSKTLEWARLPKRRSLTALDKTNDGGEGRSVRDREAYSETGS